MISFDIRKAWILCFGDDPATHKKSAPNQHVVICPFHNERNASCDVSLAKNAFICRSCEAQGGTLDAVVRSGFADDKRQAAKWLEARGAL